MGHQDRRSHPVAGYQLGTTPHTVINGEQNPVGIHGVDDPGKPNTVHTVFDVLPGVELVFNHDG